MWRAEKLGSVSLGSGLAATKDCVCQLEGSNHERGSERSRARFFRITAYRACLAQLSIGSSRKYKNQLSWVHTGIHDGALLR
jgi:hypothetical protein